MRAVGSPGNATAGSPGNATPTAAAPRGAPGHVPSSALSVWGYFGGKQELGSFSSFLMLLPKILAKRM